MTDEELIARLRLPPAFAAARIEALVKERDAADRIEQLQADVAGWVSNAYAALEYQREAEYKLEAAEAKLTKAVGVINNLLLTCYADDHNSSDALEDARRLMYELKG